MICMFPKLDLTLEIFEEHLLFPQNNGILRNTASYSRIFYIMQIFYHNNS